MGPRRATPLDHRPSRRIGGGAREHAASVPAGDRSRRRHGGARPAPEPRRASRGDSRRAGGRLDRWAGRGGGAHRGRAAPVRRRARGADPDLRGGPRAASRGLRSLRRAERRGYRRAGRGSHSPSRRRDSGDRRLVPARPHRRGPGPGTGDPDIAAGQAERGGSGWGGGGRRRRLRPPVLGAALREPGRRRDPSAPRAVPGGGPGGDPLARGAAGGHRATPRPTGGRGLRQPAELLRVLKASAAPESGAMRPPTS